MFKNDEESWGRECRAGQTLRALAAVHVTGSQSQPVNVTQVYSMSPSPLPQGLWAGPIFREDRELDPERDPLEPLRDRERQPDSHQDVSAFLGLRTETGWPHAMPRPADGRTVSQGGQHGGFIIRLSTVVPPAIAKHGDYCAGYKQKRENSLLMSCQCHITVMRLTSCRAIGNSVQEHCLQSTT